MNHELRWLAIVAVALLVDACVVYQPVPVDAQLTERNRIDRSWDAAAGAMSDQGLTIVSHDRNAGFIRGSKAGTTVTAQLDTLADGRIQVAFNSTGAADPGLVDRVTDSYNRRMGR